MDNTAFHFIYLNAKQPVRVAAYIRISSEEELKETGSFRTQQQFFKNSIKARKDWQLAGIYGDYAKSGTQIYGRQSFQQMLQDAALGKLDYILTKSVSRFARNTADCLESIRRLSALGVGIYFLEQGFDTSNSYGELILTVLASIAEMEAESNRENQLLIHRTMNAKGTPVIAARYGYRRNKLQWFIQPQEAERVKLAFAAAAKSETITTIVQQLNCIEKKEETGKHWSSASVKRMLTNEIYVGDLLTNKYCTLHTAERKKTVRNKGLADQFYIHDHHEPIVNRKLFETVGRLLKESSRRHCRG